MTLRLVSIVAIASIAVTAAVAFAGAGDQSERGTARASFPVDWSRAAVVIVDPQVDTLSPEGEGWDLFGEQITKRNTVENLRRLRDAAEASGIPVFYSRVEVTEEDYESWTCRNGLQSLMASRGMFVPGAGAEFIEALEPTEETILLSPRKGPSSVHSDLNVQMRQRGIETIVFAGMVANLCVESHVREAADSGFNAVVVGDAIATVSDAMHDATLADFSLMATAVVTTDETVGSLGGATGGAE